MTTCDNLSLPVGTFKVTLFNELDLYLMTKIDPGNKATETLVEHVCGYLDLGILDN